jgi:hypothetical protein
MSAVSFVVGFCAFSWFPGRVWTPTVWRGWSVCALALSGSFFLFSMVFELSDDLVDKVSHGPHDAIILIVEG